MLALRTRFSFLSHPVEHRGGNAIRNLVAHEELLEIVQCHSRDFLPHMAPAAGNVGRDNRTWNGSQRIVYSEGSTGSVTSRAQRKRPERTSFRRALRSIKPPRAMLMTVAPSGSVARFFCARIPRD